MGRWEEELLLSLADLEAAEPYRGQHMTSGQVIIGAFELGGSVL